MDDEEMARRARDFEESLIREMRSGPVVGGPVGGDALHAVADLMLRQGVPVTNARVVGTAIEFDVAVPRGVG